ncbi:unnamed protein product [Hyaloperonospora brassicae]|uniref:Uncharacterized protein n=1 Tax=Hyaloperonospora brassicae TaxID=162125 RepID=A0AAV0T0E9_HYABA|nr:unnamed protein product [Hyaloperonospora brassicae]
MRSGCLSYEKFCTEGDLLQRRSQELASRQKVGTESRVATWEWQTRRSTGELRKCAGAARRGRSLMHKALAQRWQHLAGNAYLVSSGIARPCSPNGMNGTNVVMTRHVRDDDDDVKEQEQLIEEDACAGDDEMQTTVQHQQDERQRCNYCKLKWHCMLAQRPDQRFLCRGTSRAGLSLVQPVTGISPHDYYAL